MADKKSNLLPWGFKTHSEKIAEGFRTNLSLPVHAPLNARVLAEYLNVDLYPHPASESSIYPPLSHECSGVTILDRHGKPFIVYNALHPLTRQESTLMHELAHVICKHFEENLYPGIAIPDNLRGHNPRQEAEAAYLGGCLQLPRVALVHASKQRMTEEQITEVYGASLEMVRYRMRITGVEKQMKKK